MRIAEHFLTRSSPCSYLPAEACRMEYIRVHSLSAAEYSELLLRGWRRFGHDLFRPRCPACSECKSLRIPVASFEPDRSQRRNARQNGGTVERHIAKPEATAEKLALFTEYHHHQVIAKGWSRPYDEEDSFRSSFLQNPFATEEWTYRIQGELVGLGFVDALPVGLSAIYFVHGPAQRERGLGTWNVLSLIDEAGRRGLPHVYLGYHVAGCPSLAYKARFRPHEVHDGASWVAVSS